MRRSLLRRTVCGLLLLAAVAVPAAAQRDRGPGVSLERLISVLRERLGSPFMSLWEKGRADIDPNGAPAPAPESNAPPDPAEGRIHIDPNG